MRVTTFARRGETVTAEAIAEPEWQPFRHWQGEPLTGVELVELRQLPRAELQLVRIRAGGHFVMHTSPDLAFCQIVAGQGVLRLPDDRRLPYQGPELYVFAPGSWHEWMAVTQDTLLSVVLLRRPDEL